ncbi:MAG: peptidoglycan editing factor PgeF [Rhizobiaceae bacterium]
MLTASLPNPLRSPLLDTAASSGVRHGYFTRVGGVSDGLYAGLNTGTGSNDDPEHVAENRRRVASWMGVSPEALLSLHQVHSPDAIVVSEPYGLPRPMADGIVTNRPGLAICTSSADCGPVLFVDPDARVIGAAHAGWKGAFTGVLESTIEKMETLGAKRDHILAALGPSITQANYEVGFEFVERFMSAGPQNHIYFVPSERPNHAMFDLNRYTIDRLEKAGVKAEALNRCTYAEENLFYSYRRSTHRNEPDYGRHVASIVLEDI